jgi:hypothetical protein
MSFSIRYLRQGKEIWVAVWPIDLPPSCHFVQYSLLVHDADMAIVSDESGGQLTVEKLPKSDG